MDSVTCHKGRRTNKKARGAGLVYFEDDWILGLESLFPHDCNDVLNDPSLTELFFMHYGARKIKSTFVAFNGEGCAFSKT